MNRRFFATLVAGDFLALGLVTAVGFASHGTLATAGSRMLSTLIPLIAAWAAAAPFLGAYNLERVVDLRQLWRPFWAMVLAGPLAAWLRGVWLGAPILPLFVLILTGVGVLGILIWRAAFIWFARPFLEIRKS